MRKKERGIKANKRSFGKKIMQKRDTYTTFLCVPRLIANEKNKLFPAK
jgi:hypothetical protein